MGLRERTKLKNQQNILKTAEEKFKQQGYQHTSMTEIARDAEVGTGTIYNYFPSKGALLITLFSQEMNALRSMKQTELKDHSDDFSNQLMQLLRQILTILNHYPKSFWRELIPVMTEQSKEQTELLHQTFQLDMEAIVWFEELIHKHAHEFKVPIDRKEASYAIYSVICAQTIAYMFDNSMMFEQLLDNIKRQIHFLFDGKISGKAKGED